MTRRPNNGPIEIRLLLLLLLLQEQKSLTRLARLVLPQNVAYEEEDEEEEFIYHKYTYTSNFRLINVSDGLPEKQYPSMPATHVRIIMNIR